MDAIRARRFLMLISCCLLTALLGCSGGQTPDIPDYVDTSQLPPEQQVLDWALKGDLARLKTLVAADPSLLDVRGDYERTSLHFAAASGHSDVVKYLLEQGADPNAADVDGFSPADAARQMGHTNVAKILADAANQVREQPSGS